MPVTIFDVTPPHPSGITESVVHRFVDLHAALLAVVEKLEARWGNGSVFEKELWQRPDGGGGQTCILRGACFEKAGIHCSFVGGQVTDSMKQALYGRAHADAADTFWAGGVSLILHPRNPHVPSVHLNVRRVQVGNVWYGGGADLTPMLDHLRSRDSEDAIRFHRAMRAACTKHHQPYETYAEACDAYFFLPHRGMSRGVGGVFFDDLLVSQTTPRQEDSPTSLNTPNPTYSEAMRLDFCQSVVEAFIESYEAIVNQRAQQSWTDAQRDEQSKWRSLYAEFNLLYDRGTAFGLRSGGNVKAILSSLPPIAKWD